jgi:hypothetical protein
MGKGLGILQKKKKRKRCGGMMAKRHEKMREPGLG